MVNAPYAPYRHAFGETEQEVIRSYAGMGANSKRAFARWLADYFTEFPHEGQRMAIYASATVIWNDNSDEPVSERTMRHWVRSVTDYSKDDLKRFHLLTDAQLIAAVELASDSHTAQDICQWAVDNTIRTVAAMRAHFLPHSVDSDGNEESARVTQLRRWVSEISDPKERRRAERILIPAAQRWFPARREKEEMK